MLEVQKYFNDLGYAMPSNMDVADFLQELPTSSARRFIDEVGGLVMRVSFYRCNCILIVQYNIIIHPCLCDIGTYCIVSRAIETTLRFL